MLAPDDGVISSRSATVGTVLPAGQELFRLIRGGRHEWRAEVAASDLAKLQPGQIVRLTLPGGGELEGRVRTIAPLVDVSTRNGTVYVDLPASDVARAGMFARGEFELGTRRAMTLPQSAVLLRDGSSYVMRLGPDSRVVQTKVTAGQRVDERVEIAGGIEASARVVASGGAFLALFVTGSALSMPSMIGLIMLMGIATKNSILLIDYTIIARRDHGLERRDAIIDACRKRARPIVMTTIAMGAGMLPIALGWGPIPASARRWRSS